MSRGNAGRLRGGPYARRLRCGRRARVATMATFSVRSRSLAAAFSRNHAGWTAPARSGPQAAPSRHAGGVGSRDKLATCLRGGAAVARANDLPLDEDHRAGLEITNGNPEVYKELYSRADEATLANPFGPPARGWSEISATLDRAATKYRDGDVVGFENVSTVVTPDLAYTVEVESYRARVGGASDMSLVAIRVTTVFRRENGSWKVVHRHA